MQDHKFEGTCLVMTFWAKLSSSSKLVKAINIVPADPWAELMLFYSSSHHEFLINLEP